MNGIGTGRWLRMLIDLLFFFVQDNMVEAIAENMEMNDLINTMQPNLNLIKHLIAFRAFECTK